MSSTKSSETIWLSVKVKQIGVLSIPAVNIKSFKNSLNSLGPNLFVISTCLKSISSIWEASLVADCFPEPPTPTIIAFPLGCLRTLATLRIWSMQSSKNTRFIFPVLLILKSSKLCSNCLNSLLLSLISSYSLTGASSFSKSPHIIGVSENNSPLSTRILNWEFTSSVIFSSNQPLSCSSINLSLKTLDTSFTQSLENASGDWQLTGLTMRIPCTTLETSLKLNR
mmetsp:Transcript_6046/g.5650  ORF Transcript_6046/g.5650 Transcript_6046/m.5650 type:complete len:225 (-) Transcript_6046:2226-2900(-)